MKDKLYDRLIWNIASVSKKWKILKQSIKKNTPKVALIGLTFRCPCNCTHCCMANYPKEKNKELTTYQFKKLIDQLDQMGVSSIHFTGGEPLVREDIFELIHYASNKKIVTVVNTNGLYLTKEVVKKLKLSKLDLVELSVDSAFGLTHDKLRGAKCFTSVIEATEILKKEGIPYTFVTYVSKRSLMNGELKKIADLGKKLNIRMLRLFLGIPSGKFFKNKKEILNKKEIDLVNKQISLIRNLKVPLIFYHQEKGCKAVNYIFISPYGDVHPCFFMPLSFGNVKEKSIKDIWDYMNRHCIFSNKISSKNCRMLDNKFRKKYIQPYSKEWPIKL